MSVKLSKVSQLLRHVRRLRYWLYSWFSYSSSLCKEYWQGNKQGNQLPGVLFVIVWTTVLFEWFPFTKWPFNTGQDNRNSSSGLSKGWPRPLNRGDCLIEVKIAVIKGSNFRGFDNWPLNRGWPLNTGPLIQVRLYFLVFSFDCWMRGGNRERTGHQRKTEDLPG